MKKEEKIKQEKTRNKRNNINSVSNYDNSIINPSRSKYSNANRRKRNT